MCIQGCEFCVAFEHVTAWRTFIIIIIIIIAPCASGRVRLSHCLPYPPSRMPLPWPHSSSSTLLCLSLSFNSPSPSGLWSQSRPSTFWCPPQCCKTVVHTLSPEYVS